ncbi:MAG: hypothetical protein AB7L13_12300 [Acidimicrobiia bacterium]
MAAHPVNVDGSALPSRSVGHDHTHPICRALWMVIVLLGAMLGLAFALIELALA